MDSLKNFAYSTVATAPSPATSGTSLVVQSGNGALFPTAPFDATIWPAYTQPTATNAEIVRVTNVTSDTFTITRAQYGTTAQSITTGYQIAQTIDANLLNQLLPLTGGTLTGALSGTTATWSGEDKAADFNATGITGATAGARFVGGTTSGSPASGTFAVGDMVIDHGATIWVCTVAGTVGSGCVFSPVPANSVTRRSATATANLGEITIFQGSTSGQTITLPANPTAGITYIIVNTASVTVNILGGTDSLVISGTTYSASTPFTVGLNYAYTFVFDGSGIWYATASNDLSFGVGTLQVSHGGTGVTTSTGSGSTVLSANPVLTAPFEAVSISATALSGSTSATVNVASASSYLYTANPTATWILAITNAPTTTGQSVTVALGVVQGSTGYLPKNITINGTQAGASSTALPLQGATNNSITSYYQSGTAWSAANTSTLEYYTLTVICTGSSAWTLLLAQTKF